jgi:D-arabinose 1-dehydrogenase-like Zn-dependent alcohol dehydrogenase
MKAAGITDPEEPLQIKELSDPKNEEVLMKVKSCGICPRDVHLWDGGYAGLKSKFMSVK